MGKMKDSGVEWIGEIPEDWEIISTKNIFRIYSGATPKSEVAEYWDGNIIWITPADYKTKDKYVSVGRKNISIKGLNSCSAYVIPENSIIFSKRAPIGSVAINAVPLCTNQGCLACVPIKDVDIRYFYYLMSILTEQFELYGSGTTFKEISAECFANFKLIFPEFELQKNIADYLDEEISKINSVIDKTKTTIEDYKEYKQTIITETVTKGLNKSVEYKESTLQWVDKIPKEWDMRKILHITSIPVIDGPHVSPDLVDEGVPYISADAIENGKINFEKKRGYITKEYSQECNKRYKPQKNDILVVKLGASTGKIGIVGDNTNFNIWVPLAVVRCKNNINPKFVFYAMQSGYFKNEIRNGWTFGTQETLGVKTLEQLFVFIPSCEEQEEIAEYLDIKCAEIDKLISSKEALISELEAYKKSVIYEYVTGKKSLCE